MSNESTRATTAPDPITDFQEGQWWVAELDGMAQAEGATPDQKRAVAVVHHMLRTAREPAPVARDPKSSGCRMTGGICACHSGGSFGGCVRERDNCCAVGAGVARDLPTNDEVCAEVHRQRDAISNARFVSPEAVRDVMAAVRALARGVARDLDVEAERLNARCGALIEAENIARCHDLGTVDGHSIGDAIGELRRESRRSSGSGDKANSAPPAPWISVDERLPARYEEVIVWPHPTDYCMTAELYGESASGRPVWKYGEYITGFGHEVNEITSPVTHWMPLPAAPSAGSAGTQTGSAPAKLKADCDPMCGYIGADCNFPACKMDSACTKIKESK